MKAVILFTRVPLPGSAKTRLQGFLTAEECADFQQQMLTDISEELIRMKNVRLFVFATPEPELGRLSGVVPETAEVHAQTQGPLGERMRHAVQSVLDRGANRVVLIGSDIPDMDATYIESAFAALEESDIVLGPTEDGGYCLIGLHTLEYEPFSIPAAWSTSNVMQATGAVVRGRGAKVIALPPLQDIDTQADYFRWIARRGSENTHTAAWIRRREDGNRKAE